MPASRRSAAHRAALGVAVAAAILLGTACSSSGDGGASSEAGATESSTDGAAAAGETADPAGLALEGEVDRVIAMIPPGAGDRPPDSSTFGGGTILGARHVLRAPTGDGGMIDLWIMRVRSPQLGPGVQECRVMESSDGSGSGSSCTALAQAGPPVGQLPLVQGGIGDGTSFTMELSGPADMTHFILTAGEQRIGVIPIQGQALVYFADCPAGMTVAAWRGDEPIREEPSSFC